MVLLVHSLIFSWMVIENKPRISEAKMFNYCCTLYYLLCPSPHYFWLLDWLVKSHNLTGSKNGSTPLYIFLQETENINSQLIFFTLYPSSDVSTLHRPWNHISVHRPWNHITVGSHSYYLFLHLKFLKFLRF